MKTTLTVSVDSELREIATTLYKGNLSNKINEYLKVICNETEDNEDLTGEHLELQEKELQMQMAQMKNKLNQVTKKRQVWQAERNKRIAEQEELADKQNAEFARWVQEHGKIDVEYALQLDVRNGVLSQPIPLVEYFFKYFKGSDMYNMRMER